MEANDGRALDYSSTISQSLRNRSQESRATCIPNLVLWGGDNHLLPRSRSLADDIPVDRSFSAKLTLGDS
jgi:hypothetical protein